MLRSFWFLGLGIGVCSQAIAQPELDRSYVALYETAPDPALDLKTLRRNVEQEQTEELDKCHTTEKALRSRLNRTRDHLKNLNTSSPYDTVSMTDSRENLHQEISAVEQSIRDKQRECEHFIPTMFAVRIAKLDVLEHWPRKREQTIQAIEDGRGRQRKHGDIDDIGYRKIADDQQKDIEIGEQAVRQMAGSGMMPKPVSDAAVQRYVQDLAERIATSSDVKVPIHASVLDTDDINAIAIPGGFLFLTSGLILSCNSESELAAILSQQIAHVAARHSTHASKRSFVSKAFVPAAQVATGLVTGGVSNAGAIYGLDYGFQGLGVLTDRALANGNGKAQKEADQLGIQFAWNAGFDPMGLVAFLDSIANVQEFSRSSHLLVTKRSLGDRLLDAFTEIQYLPVKQTYIRDSEDFQVVKQRLERS
jgi:Zn-dependent protease with chaperone function